MLNVPKNGYLSNYFRNLMQLKKTSWIEAEIGG
jgi:hypothetical protein